MPPRFAARRDGMLAKLLALAVLAAVYALFITNRVPRSSAVVAGSVAMVALVGFNESDIIGSIHWEALGLIFGMFLVVGGLKESGFFRWIGLVVLRAVHYRPLPVFVSFAALAALLSAFMDSITVLIFMASLSLEVCALLRVSPIPYLVAQITSANIGGAGTMIGDPPNVVIGTALDLQFIDFLIHTGPPAILAFAINLGIFLLWKGHIGQGQAQSVERSDLEVHTSPFEAVKDIRLMRVSLLAFVFTVTLLILHHTLDLLLAFVTILGGSLVLLLGGKGAKELVDHADWDTIVFLAGLFVLVGGLESTGLLADMAHGLTAISGGSPWLLLTLILWISAGLSALLDNVPYAAAMIPVIRDLAATTGLPITTLAWTLALGTNLGGNATPIGASANVVGLGIAEKGNVKVGWTTYCSSALPGVLLTVAAVNVFIVLRYVA